MNELAFGSIERRRRRRRRKRKKKKKKWAEKKAAMTLPLAEERRVISNQNSDED
jgi:hypothetical protein